MSRLTKKRMGKYAMLPQEAWPVSPYRPMLQGPRPQLDPERRDAIADFDAITAAKPKTHCMAIVGYAAMSDDEIWASRRWSDVNPTEVHCGDKATVHIGCNFCTKCGAQALASEIRIQFRNAYQDSGWETRKRVVGHPLDTRWEEWQAALAWPLYHRGPLDGFGHDALELGIRVCEEWHPDYFPETEDDFFRIELPDFDDVADAVAYARVASAALVGAGFVG